MKKGVNFFFPRDGKMRSKKEQFLQVGQETLSKWTGLQHEAEGGQGTVEVGRTPSQGRRGWMGLGPQGGSWTSEQSGVNAPTQERRRRSW